MKVLLMSPFMSYKDRWGQYCNGAGDTFPQGIGSIAGYLEKHGVDVDVIEPDIEKMDEASLREVFVRHDYDIIGISAFTTNVVFVYDTAKIIKSVNPYTRIVTGGAHPTLFPERTLQECDAIDYVITNEGEKPMLFLIEALKGNSDLSQVPNLFYRREGKIIQNSAKNQWLELDELPLFPYHKFNLDNYVPAPSLRKVLPTFNYMAQRGCPYSCAFCDTRTHGKKVRYRSTENVIKDLKALKETYGIRGLIFEGSNFTANPVWVEELCRKMVTARLGLVWYCMGRVDLNLDLLPLMKDAGLWCMSFGIESASEHTLRRMHKHISVQQVINTISALKKLEVRSIGSFILGYPGECGQDVMNTIQYACDLDLDIAVFFIPVPFPGTELYDDARKSGGLREGIEWNDYIAWLDHSMPIYVNPLIGEKHIRLYNYAFRKFYLRPRYILKQIKSIKSFSDLSRLLQGFKSVQGLIRKYWSIN